VASVQQIPNQPLRFAGESQPRREDALIAYTWDKFLRTGDARWPARLPMTKAVVRAMDAVTAFCASPQAGACPHRALRGLRRLQARLDRLDDSRRGSARGRRGPGCH
jgi:hypothetical protein